MADILTTDDYASLPIVHGDVRIPYGERTDQFGDLFLPQGTGPHPTVILIHGGCWRDRFGLEPLGQMASRLTDIGFAVWNLEYRRIGTGGGWPNTFLDVAVGADHLRAMAANYALDLDRVIAIGHSAGGHLACWLAGRHSLPEDSRLWTANPLALRGVLDLAGLPDLYEAVTVDLCSGAPQELMGGTATDKPKRYALGSAEKLLPYGIPHIHIVGDADMVVIDYLKRFVDESLVAGDDVTIIHLLISATSKSSWPNRPHGRRWKRPLPVKSRRFLKGNKNP